LYCERLKLCANYANVVDDYVYGTRLQHGEFVKSKIESYLRHNDTINTARH